MHMEILAVIPARGGSKGIPRKNVRDLCGKPLIAWTIEAARASRHITRTIVSTDDPQIAEVARHFGADVPFMRPADISQDLSTDVEFLLHALGFLKEKEGYEPDIIVRLMSVVPFQKAEDIDSCVEELLRHPDADSSVVVAEARQNPHKALKITPEGRLVSFMTGEGKGVEPTKRQWYEKAYFRANIVATYPRVLRETGTIVGNHVRHHAIPQERAIDIDSEIDFVIAEALLKEFGMRNSGDFV